ncbi:hypothetical protein [Microbacterium sp. zg-YB36]|uniref:hypothetical protein n=1 Tax=Microbacterium sp. zg-YB36 TaxID=2969407 RepID=UPI00214AF4D9|nr:hypothetical protein [Microbacterium sp. zg-YB36]MDL5351157.1 hypothetical protein [Microbacterium sp. zg-YB36]
MSAIEARAREIHAQTPRFAPISGRPLTAEQAFDLARDHGTNSHARAVRQAREELTAWEMVTERIDDETGAVFSTDRTQAHGWTSPSEAVANWTTRGLFKRDGSSRYRNGKIERAGVGCSVRTYFEEAN